jgi:hypothetical protein
MARLPLALNKSAISTSSHSQSLAGVPHQLVLHVDDLHPVVNDLPKTKLRSIEQMPDVGIGASCIFV